MAFSKFAIFVNTRAIRFEKGHSRTSSCLDSEEIVLIASKRVFLIQTFFRFNSRTIFNNHDEQQQLLWGLRCKCFWKWDDHVSVNNQNTLILFTSRNKPKHNFYHQKNLSFPFSLFFHDSFFNNNLCLFSFFVILISFSFCINNDYFQVSLFSFSFSLILINFFFQNHTFNIKTSSTIQQICCEIRLQKPWTHDQRREFLSRLHGEDHHQGQNWRGRISDDFTARGESSEGRPDPRRGARGQNTAESLFENACGRWGQNPDLDRGAAFELHDKQIPQSWWSTTGPGESAGRPGRRAVPHLQRHHLGQL